MLIDFDVGRIDLLLFSFSPIIIVNRLRSDRLVGNRGFTGSTRLTGTDKKI